jgi:hypothetical protein
MTNESSGEIRKDSFGQISLPLPEIIHRRCWRRGREYDAPTPVLACNPEVTESALTLAKPKSKYGYAAQRINSVRNGITSRFGWLQASTINCSFP